MTFVLSKAVAPFVVPSNVLALLVVLGAILSFTRWRRAGRRLAAAGGTVVILLVVLPVDSWLIMPLEGRFPPQDLPARVDGVVVLGGGVYEPPIPTLGGAQLNSRADRLAALIILARRYPQAEIVYTGGNATLRGDRAREADLVRGLLAELGFEPGRVRFERDARNTYENAVYTKRLADPQPGETWLLVTSAMHMPRAVGAFRAAGWSAVPFPVDFTTRQEFELLYLGTTLSGRLSGIDAAAHEWIGLFAYRLLGYTDSLFPGPET